MIDWIKIDENTTSLDEETDYLFSSAGIKEIFQGRYVFSYNTVIENCQEDTYYEKIIIILNNENNYELDYFTHYAIPNYPEK